MGSAFKRKLASLAYASESFAKTRSAKEHAQFAMPQWI